MLTGWKDAGSDHPVATRPDRVQLGLTGAASDQSGATRAGQALEVIIRVLSAAGSDFTGPIKRYWRWERQTARQEKR